ncbi:PREDICTED: uncharacterized protein LOC105557171 isoform X2 [Vollenhovia emeryi]|uniref:uncharacterized protein LOC105557171 isoform X2 n=1 Tax=Vollenhovia emeryi TaxID=411798 RepID=UPI0005F3FE9E|nr:PREDICTED: uncharacterized protein LOC105557171 isoform X2 [Vollenhovia emeryi]
MSGSIRCKTDLFEDYCRTDNFDELQVQLYSKIYYNYEDESRAVASSTTIDDMATKTNVESEMQQPREPEVQLLTLEAAAADSQETISTNETEFAQVNTLAGRKKNLVAQECSNGSLQNPSATQEKETQGTPSKKHGSSKRARNVQLESPEDGQNDAAYSKYNVVSKCMKKQILLAKRTDKGDDDSDTDESVCEVPIPPKPKPPLIDLENSDEEDLPWRFTEANEGNLILKKCTDNTKAKTYLKVPKVTLYDRNVWLHLFKASSSHKNISSKSQNTDRSSNGAANETVGKSTCIQELRDDILLNCTVIQKGAKSVNEIRQLSKSVGTNQGSKLIEDTNQKKKSPQSKSKGNNENNPQEEPTTSERNNQAKAQQNVDESNVHDTCTVKASETKLDSTIIDRKRQSTNDEVDSQPKHKRQCTTGQSSQDITPQGNGGKEGNASSNEYLESLSEEMRKYYNESHGQENFNIEKLQQGMSKDPQMWAILDEDIMPCPSSKRARYSNIKCVNCLGSGHQRYDCMLPRKWSCCYMCGMKNHTDSECPQKMCLTCGHEQDQCPDLWRRYHQTTDASNEPQDPGNVMKPLRLLYCCNCAKRGHESSTCREYRPYNHFPTPAIVTNYTDGPKYIPNVPSISQSEPETGPSSLENKTNPKNTSDTSPMKTIDVAPVKTIDVAPVKTIDVAPSVNVSTLSSSVNFFITPTSEDVAMCISQIDENLNSSPARNIWSTVKTNLKQTKVSNVPFTNILFSYGRIKNTDHKDVRMILENLTTFFRNKKHALTGLIYRKITPIFLKTLQGKGIEFEVKVGFTQHNTVLLRILAMKECIEYLYDLLKYWLNLPDKEKFSGIDVNLPVHPIKMFNLLNGRMSQLTKLGFTCYTEHIGNGDNDPRWLYNFIKAERAKLEQDKRGRQHAWRQLWRLQVKLLMIVNTEPKPNIFVRTFLEVMQKFAPEQYQMGPRLDDTTYLRFILLYNQLFVPHTSPDTPATLDRFTLEENINLRQEAIRERGDRNFPSTSSSIPQNIKVDHSSTINDQQNNKTLVDRQNVNNTLLEMSTTTARKGDEKIIKNLTQNSQIKRLNIEPMWAKSKDNQSNEVKVSPVPANKPNKKQLYYSKKERKIRLKELNDIIKSQNEKNIHNAAVGLIKEARSYKLPLLINAADEMQRQIRNQTLTPKHIRMLFKLIIVQQKYQKDVNICCKNLKE